MRLPVNAAESEDGWTALHQAACNADLMAVNALLESGADVNACDEDGWTALHCAARYPRGEVAHLLLENGANVHAMDHSGNKPLHVAATVDTTGDVVQELVAGGARLYDENGEGNTPLDVAILHGNHHAKIHLKEYAMVETTQVGGALMGAIWPAATHALQH